MDSLTGPKYCFFHPDVATRLSCVECGRSICPGCMIPFEVGFVCPFCARTGRRAGQPASPLSIAGMSLFSVAIGAGLGNIYPLLPSGSLLGCLLISALLYIIGASLGQWGFQVCRLRKTALLSFFSLFPLLLGVAVSPLGQSVFQQVLFLQESLSTANNANPLNSTITSPWFPVVHLAVFLFPAILFLRGYYRQ